MTDIKRAYVAFMTCYPFTLEDLDGERWLPIDDFPDYLVSNCGRVKSFKGLKPRILKPTIDLHGSLHIRLSKDGGWKCFLLHRLVALSFLPNPDNNPHVTHIDGNLFNNHADNLKWATRLETQAKLTPEQIRLIRANPDNLTNYQLGKRFGVCDSTISSIQLGMKYREMGGVIRDKKPGGLTRIPDDIRRQIRELYVKGSREFGCYALGRRFSIDPRSVWRIVRES